MPCRAYPTRSRPRHPHDAVLGRPPRALADRPGRTQPNTAESAGSAADGAVPDPLSGSVRVRARPAVVTRSLGADRPTPPARRRYRDRRSPRQRHGPRLHRTHPPAGCPTRLETDVPALRSRVTTHGRNAAGARALWRATGMGDDDFGRPIVAIANSYTQFVPGHVHLKDLGDLVAGAIREAGGVPREFHTIAVDDGIAMGHGGMLYSLPSREVIADAVEYMVNGHCGRRAGVHLQLRQDHPGHAQRRHAAQHPDGLRLRRPDGGRQGGRRRTGSRTRPTDLITAISASASPQVDDSGLTLVERSACPTCGSCSGMFTANSMNCLTEALGLALPGNGSTLATHAARRELFLQAGRTVMDLCRRWYEHDDASALPRNIATREAFENAMALDVAMGGSTNTVLHILAAAQEGEIDFDLAAIDAISRRVPCLSKVSPNSDYHMEDVHRAGGIPAILGELWRGGLLERRRAHGALPVARGVAGRRGTSAAEAPSDDGGRAVPRRTGRGAHHRGLLHREPLELAGHRRRGRLHPRRRARLHRGRRAGRAARQHRPGRRGDQDGRDPRGAVALRGPGAGRREPGGGRLGHPHQAGAARRRDRRPLRGPVRRAGDAGDAAPHRVPQGRRARPGVRADHRRPVLRRVVGHLGRATSRRRPPRAA